MGCRSSEVPPLDDSCWVTSPAGVDAAVAVADDIQCPRHDRLDCRPACDRRSNGWVPPFTRTCCPGLQATGRSRLCSGTRRKRILNQAPTHTPGDPIGSGLGTCPRARAEVATSLSASVSAPLRDLIFSAYTENDAFVQPARAAAGHRHPRGAARLSRPFPTILPNRRQVKRHERHPSASRVSFRSERQGTAASGTPACVVYLLSGTATVRTCCRASRPLAPRSNTQHVPSSKFYNSQLGHPGTTARRFGPAERTRQSGTSDRMLRDRVTIPRERNSSCRPQTHERSKVAKQSIADPLPRSKGAAPRRFRMKSTNDLPRLKIHVAACPYVSTHQPPTISLTIICTRTCRAALRFIPD